jgi:hypothetical protein
MTAIKVDQGGHFVFCGPNFIGDPVQTGRIAKSGHSQLSHDWHGPSMQVPHVRSLEEGLSTWRGFDAAKMDTPYPLRKVDYPYDLCSAQVVPPLCSMLCPKLFHPRPHPSR